MKHIIFFFLIYLTQFPNLSSNEPKLNPFLTGVLSKPGIPLKPGISISSVLYNPDNPPSI